METNGKPGGQPGNQNARKKHRPITDALKRELAQKPEDILIIAQKLIEDAKTGDSAARALLFDRVDGKVPQPIVGDNDEDPVNVRTGVIDLVRPG